MNKKGFFALNDDSFWGNKDDSDDRGTDDEDKKESPTSSEEKVDEASLDKDDGWIDVKDRSHNHARSIHRRGGNTDLSRTTEAQAFLLSRKEFTALEVLNTLGGEGMGSNTMARTPFAVPSTVEMTASSRPPSNAQIYHPTQGRHPASCAGGFPATPCGGFSRPTYSQKPSRHTNHGQSALSSLSGNFSPLPQSLDVSGFGAGLARFKLASRPPKTSSSASPFDAELDALNMDDNPTSLISGDSLDDAHSSISAISPMAVNLFAKGKDQDDSRNKNDNKKPISVNLMDEKNVQYYEFLCKGIQKLLESGVPLTFDCEGRYDPNSSNICAALKSKYYYQYSPGPEIYSRKVFVGGLPIDIDEEELVSTFSKFGPLTVDWPNKNETKSYFPPKGYVFLIFEYELSVRALVANCFIEDEKSFLYIARPNNSEKLVQIRPWRLADADYLVDVNIPINPRRVVFVGGVPRPIRAVELAHIMDRLYGSVSCAGIDTDVEYKYPKGAGRVAFTNYNSYMRAITDRYAQLCHGEVDKRVEMKPYVLDDQTCEECRARHAPFFCPHLECLQYYCEGCWTLMHGCLSREDHKPLVKEA